MKTVLRKVCTYLSNPHNVRGLLWKARRVMLVAAAVMETLLRDTVQDVLPA